MKNEKIKVPNYNGETWSNKEESFDTVFQSFNKSLENLPEMVYALKKADNKNWEKLFTELLKNQDAESLNKLIRENTKNGKLGISIGEPNMHPLIGIIAPAAAAFAVGYLIGTACVKLGPCDFSKK